LVTPVIEENKRSVTGYFPADKWYSYYNGTLDHENETVGKTLDLPSPIDHIQLHVRGGYIIPTQEPAITTEFSRLNPFGLIVAPNELNEATGDLFYDNGLSQLEKNQYYYATFKLRENILKMNVEHNSYDEMSSKKLNNLRIFVKDANKNLGFYLNENTTIDSRKIKFEDNQIVLKDLELPMNKDFKLTWTLNELNKEKVLIDCLVQDEIINENTCRAKNCIFNNKNISPTPKCYFSAKKGGYTIKSTVKKNEYILEKSDDFSLFKDDIQQLKLKVRHGKVAENLDRSLRVTNIKVRF
jgi:maltase-glucoamylase